MAKDLYRTKSSKNTDFMYEHCWELVKDFPRWADGVSTSRQTTPSRRVSGSSDHESQSGSQVDTEKSVSALETTGEATTSMAFTLRPGGTKAAKDAQRADKVHERAAFTQAKAAEQMAEATLRKAASLEYHNMLLLFTAPMDQVTMPEAQEYIRLLREEELLKLRRRRAESSAIELREQHEREATEMAEAARTQQVARRRARDDEKTLRQMREARGEFDIVGDDEECEPEDREIVELPESDEEDRHQCEAQHAFDEHEPSNRQFQVGGDALGGFSSDVVGQCSSYVDIRGDSVPWDDIEHVEPGMPTTWNVLGVQDNSRNNGLDLGWGLDLSLNGPSFYE